MKRTIKAIKLAKNPWTIDDVVMVFGSCEKCYNRRGRQYLTFRDLRRMTDIYIPGDVKELDLKTCNLWQ